jgi:DNA-binding transcriptional LysR family regulator
MPELRHLRYFVAVAEELNFSRAADRLHMAQPPLSVAIRQLEQELGTNLFVRTSRDVTLTEGGAALLDGARRTLAEAEGAVMAARRAAAGEVGSQRIGYNWSARFDTLPVLGRALKRTRPDVELLAEEGVVAVPISGLSEALEFQLTWRTDNHNPALAAFIALADGVFAAMPQA